MYIYIFIYLFISIFIYMCVYSPNHDASVLSCRAQGVWAWRSGFGAFGMQGPWLKWGCSHEDAQAFSKKGTSPKKTQQRCHTVASSVYIYMYMYMYFWGVILLGLQALSPKPESLDPEP